MIEILVLFVIEILVFFKSKKKQLKRKHHVIYKIMVDQSVQLCNLIIIVDQQ